MDSYITYNGSSTTVLKASSLFSSSTLRSRYLPKTKGNSNRGLSHTPLCELASPSEIILLASFFYRHASRNRGNLGVLHRAGYFPQPSPSPLEYQYHTFSLSIANYGRRLQTTTARLYFRSSSPTSPHQRPCFSKILLELHLLDRVCTAGGLRKGQ